MFRCLSCSFARAPMMKTAVDTAAHSLAWIPPSMRMDGFLLHSPLPLPKQKTSALRENVCFLDSMPN